MATPEELLDEPNNDFVSDFVGADRAIKRLSLFKMRDLDLMEVRRFEAPSPGLDTRAVLLRPETLGRDALALIEALSALKARFDGLRSVCGLSNISFGLPARQLLNRTLLGMLIPAGLDAAIVDTTDARLMSTLRAALALSNRDEYCTGYIAAYRQDKLRG